MQVLYLVWEYIHKSHNFQVRGDIVEIMIDEMKSLKHVINVNEKELKI